MFKVPPGPQAPDKWLLLKIDHQKSPTEHVTKYEILGSWYGGYADGDSWRLSSNVVKVEKADDKDEYIFTTHSGSTYQCYKNHYGAHVTARGILNALMKRYEDLPEATIEVVSEESSFENIVFS